MSLPFVSSLWIAEILVSAILAILFLQSGIDKVVDRQGNLEYLTEHFAKSPLASTVRPMVAVITLIELTAGTLSGLGCLLIVFTGETSIAFWGAVTAACGLTALFFGQRVAKDYAGAATLVPYFLLALVGILLLGKESTRLM